MPNVFSHHYQLGLLGNIFHFYSYFKRNFCKQTVENLIRRRVLPMSHKKVELLYTKVATGSK